MTDSLEHVVIPYEQFRDWQERRDKIATALRQPDHPPTTDADVPPAPPDKEAVRRSS